MRCLRWVGLLSSVLFVGVLGGLLAPRSSEAVPTLTLQVDGLPATSPRSILLTTPSPCTTGTNSETSQGYTACYGIRTDATMYTGTGGRQYRVQNAPGATARLRVADKLGQDKFSLVGVQFVPVPWTQTTPTINTSEQHVLKITMSNVFNEPVNVSNIGNYVWALRAGGEFRAGPTGSNCLLTGTDNLCDTIGDKVVYTGTGTFSPGNTNKAILRTTGANSLPLSFTVAGPHLDPILSFDGLTNATMGQVNPTYPQFNCDVDGAAGPLTKCTPTITQTMTVTLKGQDSFVLVGGLDMFDADCLAQLSAKQQTQIAFLTKLVKFLDWWADRHPNNVKLRAVVTKLEAFLATVNSPSPDPEGCPGVKLVNLDIATAAAADQQDFIEHGAVVAEAAPTGTITITKQTTEETSDTFTFDISGGPSPSTETLSMGGQTSESIVVAVEPGTYTITENPLSGWTLNQLQLRL